MPADGPPSSRTPARRIGVLGAIAVVVGSMVGTGVFTTTGFLVRDVGSNAAALVAWVLGGVMALCGALAYAELVAALPENGGEYQLLSRIYHPAVGFVSGFVSLVVGFSAPIAASAIAFGDYASRVIPGVPRMPAAIALVVLSSLPHAFRVSLGSTVLQWVTVLDVALIIVVVAVGLPAGNFEYLAPENQRSFIEAMVSPELAIGLIYVSFAYSGWNAAAYVAGEIRDPSKNLPRSLLLGTGLVTFLYLGLNLVFVIAAPPRAIAGVVEVGHVAAANLFGEAAARVVSAVVAVGLITTVVALVMTGPRVYEKMGDDYPGLRALSGRKPESGPRAAIILQALLAIGMIVTASFDELLTYMGFTLALFTGLTVAGVFVLRSREPDLPRPYRTWGHPVTSSVALGLMLWMILHALIERPLTSMVGAGTLLLGVLLYVALGARKSVRSKTPKPDGRRRSA